MLLGLIENNVRAYCDKVVVDFYMPDISFIHTAIHTMQI